VTVKHQARALPKVVEARVTRVARRLRKPRGVVLREAIEEYAARHEPEAVTQAMNRVAAVLDTRLDPGVAAASRRVLERTEW
jgi:predicted transcriptional regulator